MESQELTRSAHRHYPLVARGISEDEWEELRAGHSDMPTNFNQLCDLSDQIWGGSDEVSAAGPDDSYDDEPDSLMHAMTLLEFGLQNPALTDEEIDSFDEIVASKVPDLPNFMGSTHFACWYTTVPGEHQMDPLIVSYVIDRLERAYALYESDFGEVPLPTVGENSTIKVLFYRLPQTKPDKPKGPKGKTSPNTPISLNTAWCKEDSKIAWMASVHELFHRLQFSFGFLTDAKKKTFKTSYKWWSEGMASWAALWVTGRYIKTVENIAWTFEQPNLNSIFDAEYKALPAFLYMEQGDNTAPTRHWVWQQLNVFRNAGRNPDFVALYRHFFSPDTRLNFGASMVLGRWSYLGDQLVWKLRKNTNSYPYMYAIDSGRDEPIDFNTGYAARGTLERGATIWHGQTPVVDGGFLFYRFAIDSSAVGRPLRVKFRCDSPEVRLHQQIVFPNNSFSDADTYTTQASGHLEFEVPNIPRSAPEVVIVVIHDRLPVTKVVGHIPIDWDITVP